MKDTHKMSNKLIAFRKMIAAQNTLERILFASTMTHVVDWRGVEWALSEQHEAMRKLYFDLRRLDNEI